MLHVESSLLGPLPPMRSARCSRCSRSLSSGHLEFAFASVAVSAERPLGRCCPLTALDADTCRPSQGARAVQCGPELWQPNTLRLKRVVRGKSPPHSPGISFSPGAAWQCLGRFHAVAAREVIVDQSCLGSSCSARHHRCYAITRKPVVPLHVVHLTRQAGARCLSVTGCLRDRSGDTFS